MAGYIIQKQTFQICILGFTCVPIQQTCIYNPLYNKALHASITFAWWHRPTVEQSCLLVSFKSPLAYMTGDDVFFLIMPHVLLIGYSDTEIQHRGYATQPKSMKIHKTDGFSCLCCRLILYNDVG